MYNIFFWKELCKIWSYLFLGREVLREEQLTGNMGQSLMGTSVLVNIENLISFSLFFKLAWLCIMHKAKIALKYLLDTVL